MADQFKRTKFLSFLVVLLIAQVLAHWSSAQETAEPSNEQTQLLKTFRDEFVEIKPGTDSFPASFKYQKDREVKLVENFHVAKFELPQNLWQAIVGKNPSRWKGDRNSVEMLNFNDAAKFCDEATRLMRVAKLIDENQFVRLPTEIEWEYLARAGTETAFSFGDDEKLLTDHAWYTRNAAGNDPAVGEKKPNSWGLYDVHGYLWEWCVRCDEDGPATLNEKQWHALKPGKQQVLRGGSWKDEAGKLKSRFRQLAPTDTLDDAVGLRCVLITYDSEQGDE